MEDPISGKSWQPEHDQELKKLVSDGYSYGECSVRLNRRFSNKAFTRNSCIGRAQRLKLQSKIAPNGRGDVRKKKRPKPLSKRKVPVVLSPAFHEARKTNDKPFLNPKAVKKEPAIAPDMLRLSIMELKDGHCRWILDDQDEEYQYCGVKSKEKSSYCEYHHEVCFDHAPVKRRIKTGG